MVPDRGPFRAASYVGIGPVPLNDEQQDRNAHGLNIEKKMEELFLRYGDPAYLGSIQQLDSANRPGQNGLRRWVDGIGRKNISPQNIRPLGDYLIGETFESQAFPRVIEIEKRDPAKKDVIFLPFAGVEELLEVIDPGMFEPGVDAFGRRKVKPGMYIPDYIALKRREHDSRLEIAEVYDATTSDPNGSHQKNPQTFLAVYRRDFSEFVDPNAGVTIVYPNDGGARGVGDRRSDLYSGIITRVKVVELTSPWVFQEARATLKREVERILSKIGVRSRTDIEYRTEELLAAAFPKPIESPPAVVNGRGRLRRAG